MDALTTVLEVLGMCVIAAGFALIYVPAGVVMLGVMMVVTGYNMAGR